MIRRPPRSTQSRSSAASDVYKRVLLTPRLDRDDVRDVRGESEVQAPGVGLLHADVEAEEAQLVDDVLARAEIFRCADGAAADRAGEHADVRAGVLEGKAGNGTGARRAGCAENHEKGQPTVDTHPARVQVPGAKCQVLSAR